jgi:polysaccharide pyruvyl transferase WcaK-like protein
MNKNFLKQVITNIINAISSFAFYFSSNKKNKKALILAPSWHGSIGDEAVIDSISYQLKQNNISTTLIHFGEEKEWSYLKSIDNWYSIGKYFKTGGWSDHFKFIFFFRKYTHFYALGTDMMDGCYADWLTNGIIKITNQAAYAGLKTTLVGFSINTWQNEGVINNLANMHKAVRFCLRDDVSQKRFEELAPKRTTELTADMAFVLKPTLISEQIVRINSWITDQKANGGLMVGVNINPQLFNDDGKINELISVLDDSISQLVKNNSRIKIVLIPHDFRDNNSDLVILTKLKERLDKYMAESIAFVDEPFLASDMKGLVGQLDLVITARMHLAIASLGQNIPIGCLVYQGKFEGLFNHFKLDQKYMLDPNKALMTNELTTFIQKIIDERGLIKNTVSEQLPSVKGKSLNNLFLK